MKRQPTTAERHLLTPELRKEVEDEVKRCLKIAEKHFKMKLEMPEIRYDVKTWTGGLALINRWIIRLNLILLVENKTHYVKQIPGHEVAHLVVRRCYKVPEGRKRLMAHGKEWREVMGLFGLKPDVTHTYDCSSIEKIKRHRRPKMFDRVEQLVIRVAKLSPEEKFRFMRLYEEVQDVRG